jgi:hypothetical protein
MHLPGYRLGKEREMKARRPNEPAASSVRQNQRDTPSEHRVQRPVLKSRRVTKDFIEETLDWAGFEVVIRVGRTS